MIACPGGPIFHEGDSGDGLYIIKSGTVNVTKSVTGDRPEAVLAFLHDGDSFGEIQLIDGLPRSASVIAMEPVECYVLGPGPFSAVPEQHPEVAQSLLRPLAAMLRNTNQWVARTIREPGTQPAVAPVATGSLPVEPAGFLRELSIFQYVGSEAMRHLAGQMRLVSLKAGLVLRENDPVEGLYIIVSGTARVTKRTEGRGPEAVLAVLGRGESFGEIGLVDGLPHSASVAAVEPMECYFLGRDNFVTALRQDPKLARGLLAALASMVRGTDEWIARAI